MRAPRSLVLVRNAVTHDARVLREARTLRALGHEVLVAGVVAGAQTASEQTIEGFPVVRLEPGRGLRRALPRGRWADAASPRAVPEAEGASRPAPAATSSASAPLRRVRANPVRPVATVRRLVVTADYYRQGIALARRTAPALVHANDYNTMWIGVAAKFLCGSRLVYDSHELWADRNGRPEWRPWLIACEWLFVRVADVTITASPGYQAVIAARYGVPPPTVVRNIPAGTPRTTRAPAGGETAVYVGGLMPGRGLEQAIASLALVPEGLLRLVGPGDDAYRRRLELLAVESGVADRVTIEDAVPPGGVLDAIAGADIGLMLIQPVCRSYELTLPNKLFEYAAAGLPILASDLPVIGPLVRNHGLGEAVAPTDVAAIAAAIRRLLVPETNVTCREHVRAYADVVTWDREQAVLAAVYAPGLDRGPADTACEAHRDARPSSAIEPDREATDDERRRVSGVYRGYRASAAKRRSWSAENRGNRAIRAELVAAAFALAGPDLLAARAVLDVGCGTGWWLATLATLAADGRVGAALHGVELLGDRVAAARARVPEASIAAGDCRALPYGDGAFDVVTLFTVLSSLASAADARAALREAHRVLRPGGALLIWEPRVANPLNGSTLLVGASLLAGALRGAAVQRRPLTVLPPLARRLGRSTPGVYPLLARVPALRTHRLLCARWNVNDAP